MRAFENTVGERENAFHKHFLLFMHPLSYIDSFWPVCMFPCMSGCLQKTLTLAITLVSQVSNNELSYFTCVFLIVRPFLWCQGYLSMSILDIKAISGAFSQTHFVLQCFSCSLRY